MMELLAVRVVDGPITRPCYFATGTIGIVLAFRAPTREPTFAAWACLASFSSSALVIDCKKAEGGGGLNVNLGRGVMLVLAACKVAV